VVIPPFPQAGQPYAFVDREAQIARLYKPIVDTGNALLRTKKATGRVRAVVYGYMGVGKSSVIYQVLQMLRSPFGSCIPRPTSKRRTSISSKLTCGVATTPTRCAR
jgi:Cdc6-like AAA superfamily ATPase